MKEEFVMRLVKIFTVLFVWLTLFLSIATTTTFAEEQKIPEVIQVTGRGSAPEGAFHFQIKAFARRAAQFDALRQLAENIYDFSTDVKFKLLVKEDEITSMVTVTRLIADNARIVSEKSIGNDGYEVIMEMPMAPFIKVIGK